MAIIRRATGAGKSYPIVATEAQRGKKAAARTAGRRSARGERCKLREANPPRTTVIAQSRTIVRSECAHTGGGTAAAYINSRRKRRRITRRPRSSRLPQLPPALLKYERRGSPTIYAQLLLIAPSAIMQMRRRAALSPRKSSCSRDKARRAWRRGRETLRARLFVLRGRAQLGKISSRVYHRRVMQARSLREKAAESLKVEEWSRVASPACLRAYIYGLLRARAPDEGREMDKASKHEFHCWQWTLF